jgi:hypothetical protein
MSWPEELQINAYLGGETKAVSSTLSSEAKRWPLRNAPPKVRTFLKPPAPVDLRNWKDSNVGWGVVAAETADLTDAQKRTSSDLPEPIQELLKDRGDAPVFRYRPSWDQRFRLLRSYARGLDVAIGQSPEGLGRESIPRYLLIVGTPEQVPWELQYVLNSHYAVGRLHLTGGELENYVAALRSDWRSSTAQKNNSVIWAVNQGSNDITGLMRDAIAAKVHRKLLGDTDLAAGTKFLDGAGAATGPMLISALSQAKPGLVVTTSHGQTYPLDNPELLGNGLGILVDQNYASISITDLLTGWQPDGAIWYAHACCSAGSSAQTLFDGLCLEGSEVDRVLKGVAKLGNRVAPLPTALLGGKKPARAFIGHVEPTFDWTLRDPNTRQMLADSIEQALYSELYQPSPIGHASRKCYERLSALYASYDAELVEFGRGGATREAMLRDLLCARDVQSMVILGDPTVAFPTDAERVDQ